VHFFLHIYPRLFKDGWRLDDRAGFRTGEGMAKLKPARGKRELRRRGSSRADRCTLPRLARWAGVGVFIVSPATVNCDNDDAEEKLPAGYAYAGVMEIEKDQVYKLNAANGEKEFGIGGRARGMLSIVVDPASGDVFVYSTGSLKKYTKAGELVYDVNVYSGLDHDKMVFDDSTRAVWVYNERDGKLRRYNKGTGAEEFSFETGLTWISQLIYDSDTDSFWIVNFRGMGILKFSKTGKKLLEIKDSGKLTAMALDPGNNTLLIGYYDSAARKNSVRRYRKDGSLVDEFPTALSPVHKTRFITVEPGTRRIWVSDGDKIEVYDEAGVLYRTIEGTAYVRGDFGPGGKTFFGITTDGEIHALRLPSFDTLWTAKAVTEREKTLAIKYSTY
jgi:hypothetical protein